MSMDETIKHKHTQAEYNIALQKQLAYFNLCTQTSHYICCYFNQEMVTIIHLTLDDLLLVKTNHAGTINIVFLSKSSIVD